LIDVVIEPGRAQTNELATSSNRVFAYAFVLTRKLAAAVVQRDAAQLH
jgi:hypothetical protein